MKRVKNQSINIVRFVLPTIEWGLAAFSIGYAFYRGFEGLPLSWLFNVSADLICMFINLFLVMGVLLGATKIDRRYTRFLMICHACFSSLFLDFCSWMMDGRVGQGLLMAVNTSLYIANILLTAAFAYFIVGLIVEKSKQKTFYLIIFIGLGIAIVLRIVNIFTGYLFTVSEDGIYSRGSLQFLAFFYTIFIGILVLIILARSKVRKEQRNAILAFSILPLAATLISIFIYGLSLMFASVLIAIVMIYSAFSKELNEDKDKIIGNFEKYISNDIVQRIINHPGSHLIEGRRYNATVLVSDIRGFTALTESMPAEKLIEMLNHYYGVLSDIINSCGGVVAEFLGDGIMCVFGAPNASETHADAAIAAGLLIQEAADGINRWNKEHGYPEIYTGVGIHSGAVVMGSLGNEKHAKYSAVGQTVDRAFDIESCSLGGQVLVSSATLRSVKGTATAWYLSDFVIDPEEGVKIKVYEVIGLSGAHNIQRERVFEQPKALADPLQSSFCILNGKEVDGHMQPCRICALSDRAAILETTSLIEVFNDIMLELSPERSVFAKAESIEDGRILVAFTSKTV